MYCYPLTIVDNYSRYILRINGQTDIKTEPTQKAFERLFREVGMPQAIRSDNGAPFATTGIHGLGRLNVWWLRLGISHQRIVPGHPQDNGAHERMHRDLKDHCTHPVRANRRGQQRAFDKFADMYNHERPHESLGDKMPASRWRSSRRAFPDEIPLPEYKAHWLKRRVSSAGLIRLASKAIFISQALWKDDVALEEIENGIWNVYFYDTLLGRIDERIGRLSA